MAGQQMNYADAAWLHMDRPTNLMVVNSLLWFDEPVDLERTREILRVRLVERFPRFRQRVIGRQNGASGISEDVLHAQPLQAFPDNFGAGHFSRRGCSAVGQWIFFF